MALMKRGRTWHTHFFVDGQRVRQPLETKDWREAQAKEKELIAQVAQGNVVASHQGFAKLPFSQAADSYFSGRKLELSESSQKKERQLLVKPRGFFQEKCLAKITAEDGLPGLRFHDLRHHAITELAESQVSDQTIMAIAGHVSQKMLARYSHVRSEARRQAVMALSARPMGSRLKGSKSEGYDTNHDTKESAVGIPAPEVIENMVGTRRLELLTSTVSR
jgi:Phage integrase family